MAVEKKVSGWRITIEVVCVVIVILAIANVVAALTGCAAFDRAVGDDPNDARLAREDLSTSARTIGSAVGGAVAGPAGATLGGLIADHGLEAALGIWAIVHKLGEKKRHARNSAQPEVAKARLAAEKEAKRRAKALAKTL